MAKRILIVDDSPLILATARHALLDAGYDVETRTGVEDLVGNSTQGFDLILMDVQMPELYGDDVAAVLRDQRDLTTPICLYSALPPEELEERAKEAGVRFISKQTGVAHLVTEVGKLLA